MKYRVNKNHGYLVGLVVLLFFLFGGFRLFFLVIGLAFLILPVLIFAYVAYILITAINKNTRITDFLHTQTQAHNQFFELLVRLSAQVISADGRIDPVEIQTVKNFFMTNLGFSANALLWIGDLIAQEARDKHNLYELVSEMNRIAGYDLRLVVLELLYQIAMSDFEYHSQEETILAKIAGMMEIMAVDHQTIRNRYLQRGIRKGADVEQYYRRLGLEPGATKDEIKSAYRRLVKKFHPDVVAHLGPQIKASNEAKLLEITEAYDRLTSRKQKM